MIGLIVGLLPATLNAKLARGIAWAVVIVGALALLWGAKALYDASVIDRHEAEREAAAGEAREEAADERVADAIKNTRNEQELHDAIDNAPKGGELSPAARALACERLRKLGRVPPACGPQGGGGAETDPG